MGNFMSIEIGKRAVLTEQSALSVTGHNVANANTEGYSRQIAELVTTHPWHTPCLNNSNRAGQLGTGVTVDQIKRMRDEFLDVQIRGETEALGYWNALQESLARIEGIINEPSEEGLRGVMDEFWEAWQDLSLNPESEAVRSVVVNRGLATAEAFNHTFSQLSSLREDVNATIAIKMDEINTIAKQIAALNKEIMAVTAAQKQPNDLLDKRDLLVDQLSQLANVKTYDEKHGMIAVQLGDRLLVQGKEYTGLDKVKDGEGMYMLVWSDTQARARISNGELRGLMDLRGKTQLEQEREPTEYKEIIPNMIAQLNTLAKTIVTKTNEIHRTGYSLNNKTANPDDTDFFVMPDEGDGFENWAQFMKVSTSIQEDANNIAAASSRTWDDEGNKINFGDGSNALSIAQLKHSLNSEDLQVQTEDLSSKLTYPFTGTISLGLTVGSSLHEVNIASATSYNDLAEVAAALDTALETYGIDVSEDTETPNTLIFSSSDSLFKNIQDFTLDDGGTPVELGDYHVLTVSDATTDDFWRSISAEIGVISQEAVRMVANQNILVAELESKRQSMSGVSLDEELTNMIKFQHAYNAAARFITSIDEAIDVIVNRMGLVGRA